MFQELIIVGYLGKDPELRYTADGKATTTLNVTSSRNTAKGEKESTWFSVICWEKTAEYMCNYAQKGTKLVVRGRLVVDPVTGGPRIFTRQDGTAGAKFEVVADTVKLIHGYKQVDDQNRQQTVQHQYQQTQQQRPAQPQQTQYKDSYQEDIPW